MPYAQHGNCYGMLINNNTNKSPLVPISICQIFKVKSLRILYNFSKIRLNIALLAGNFISFSDDESLFVLIAFSNRINMTSN
jgi:hypothetical protein